jgi:peptidoglycan/xylan/chitin deacetylase (PgdA/CDA1 family)
MLQRRWVTKVGLSGAYHYTGIQWLHRRMRGREAVRVPIVMYHSISDGSPGSLQLEKFLEQLGVIREYYTPIRLEQLLALLDGRARASDFGARPPVVLTFDDGFKDNYDVVLPLLERYGFPAVIFVPTDYLGRENFWEQHHYNIPRREIVTAEQLADMHRRGLALGGHTCSHPHLSELPSEAAEREIATGRAVIEELIGEPVRTFAYPFGQVIDWTPETAAIVERLGFVCACSTVWGTVHRPEERYWLGRIAPEPFDTALTFRWKLEGRFDWLRLLHLQKYRLPALAHRLQGRVGKVP